MNALPLILFFLAIIAIAYRYYSAFLAAKVMALDDARVTPAHRFEDAIVALTLLGRDGDAAKLGAALAQDEPAAFTAKVAAATLLPALRSL